MFISWQQMQCWRCSFRMRFMPMLDQNNILDACKSYQVCYEYRGILACLVHEAFYYRQNEYPQSIVGNWSAAGWQGVCRRCLVCHLWETNPPDCPTANKRRHPEGHYMHSLCQHPHSEICSSNIHSNDSHSARIILQPLKCVPGINITNQCEIIINCYHLEKYFHNIWLENLLNKERYNLNNNLTF